MPDMQPVAAEDTHFYIDNAPPDEVRTVLFGLDLEAPLSNAQIADRARTQLGFQLQRDTAYSTRRLSDLGLALKPERPNRKTYLLTPLGARMRALVSLDPSISWDAWRYLHYTGYNGQPYSRKLLWSYRVCCEAVWREKLLLPTAQLAGAVQSLMREQFPQLDLSARLGSRFDSTAVGRCYTWLMRLSPMPFSREHPQLRSRTVHRHELALLALDHVYRARGYRYGDPAVLDGALLDEIARVFFLDLQCCRELLLLASRVTRAVRMADTLAGPSVTLVAPYTIECI